MQLNRTITSAIAATSLALMAFLPVVAAAGEAPYDKATFQQLKAEGKPIVVDFSATWCPTCKAQRPSVQSLAADPAFKSLTILLADYDQEKELKKELNVTQQSTFVVFKNGKEVTRSTGQTKKEDITATFAKAL